MTPTNIVSSVSGMKPVATPFIPANELHALVRGSHQELTAHIAELVRTEARIGGNEALTVLATFDTHAVVLSESGDVFKVRYDRSQDGKLHLLGHDQVPVTVVTDKSLRRYAKSEAAQAVDLFLQGLTSAANAKVTALFPLVDSLDPRADVDIVSNFQESRQTTLIWKAMIESRKEGIAQYLAEDTLPDPLKARFSSLYDGSTSPEELPEYKSLVHGDMGVLLQRLDTVAAQAKAALEAFRAVKQQAEAEGQPDAVNHMETLAGDLLRDVASVKEFVEDAVRDFKQVDLLAKVFDSVATEVASFEVASAFATKVATRLTDTGR